MAVEFIRSSSEALTLGSAPVTAAPLSMACWFNSVNVADEQGLVSLADVNTTNNYWVLALRGPVPADNVEFSVNDGISSDTLTTTGYSANTWHHAACAEDSSSLRRVYIDGGSQGFGFINHTPSGIDNVGIGRYSSSTPFSYMDGRIAEVGIWNIALSAAEFALLAKGFSPLMVRPDALVFYMPGIRDVSAGNWREYIGGVNLTEIATPTVGVHVPTLFVPAPPVIELNPAASGVASHGLTPILGQFQAVGVLPA